MSIGIQCVVGPSHGPIRGLKRQTQRRQEAQAEPEITTPFLGKSDCHVGLYVNWATRPAPLGLPLADLLFCIVASGHFWYWDVTAALCLGSCQRPEWGGRISSASPGLYCMEYYQVPLPSSAVLPICHRTVLQRRMALDHLLIK